MKQALQRRQELTIVLQARLLASITARSMSAVDAVAAASTSLMCASRSAQAWSRSAASRSAFTAKAEIVNYSDSYNTCLHPLPGS